MIEKWIPIRYRDFYDFPRAFVVEHDGDLLFFDCPFNEELDDYPPDFTVYRLASSQTAKVDAMAWNELTEGSQRMGSVRTGAVTFDETRRQSVRSDVLDLIR